MSAQSIKQYWANVSVSTSRGLILDSEGDILAHSVPSYSFFVDPKFWDPANAGKLKNLVPVDIVKDLSRNLPGRFFPVLRKTGMDKGLKIINLGLPGLYSVSEKQRLYPNRTLLAHILGFCDIDDHGQSGLELLWDPVLYSPPVTKTLIKDSSGQRVDLADIAMHPGEGGEAKISLTIDSTLQYILETRLEEGSLLNGAKWAAAICMDPVTGAILSMASWPSFNPNRRSTFSSKDNLLNNAIGRVYEPGSTFKPIIMGLSLENKLVRRNESFLCKRRIKVADKVVSDPKAYGKLSLDQLIVKSSNVGMSQIGIRFNAFDTYHSLMTWGFGKKPGIELPGAEKGLLPPPDQWRGVVPANIAIGQGIAVTPLQLITAISAIANGGHLLKPFIVNEVRDSSGTLRYRGRKREVATVISYKTAKWLRSVLRDVVLKGTGTLVNSPITPIAGKTGTAQVAEKGIYKKGKWVSSFVGFWPYEAPQFSLLIVIGEPSKGKYYGGTVAGPVFRKIVEDMYRMETIDLVMERE